MCRKTSIQSLFIVVIAVVLESRHSQATSVHGLRHAQFAPQAFASNGSSPSAHASKTAGAAMVELHDGLQALLQRGGAAVQHAWNGHPTAAYHLLRERRQSFKEHSAIALLSTFTILVWITLTGAAAHFYRNTKQWPDMPQGGAGSEPGLVEADFQEFHSGPFDCMQDNSSCCWATWCPCIRWADNMGMVNIIGYWFGICIFCGMVMLCVFPFGIIVWFFASLLWMSFRQKLRQKFGMEHSSVSTYFGDWLLYCCCCCCAISQEARHIDTAGRAGHKAVSKPRDLEEQI
jgi:Cys-rich protein (TIGR01571 family)